ncbi:MAG: carboxypeptidase-like regulatory domain-containing protein [Cyclobacteriaceae bacterium]
MNSGVRSTIIFFIYWIFLSLYVMAQTSSQQINLSYQNTSLSEIIAEMEDRYGLRFSYMKSIIEGIEVSVDINNKPLKSALKALLSETDISFEIVDEHNIILFKIERKKKKPDDGGSFTLQGRVITSNPGEPIELASVALINLNQGTLTDSQGHFELTRLAKGKYILSISFVGYQPFEQIIDINDNIDVGAIKLSESIFRLKPVEITPGVYEISTIEPTPLGLSRQEILHSPNFAKDVYRAIQVVPGVVGTQYSAKPRIRGGHPDETAVFLDNFEIYEPFHIEELDGPFSIFNTDYLQEVKIVTGGYSARYTDKMSGIINLTTPGYVTKTNTKLSIDALSAALYSTIKLKEETSLLVSARRGYIDQILDPELGLDPIYYDIWGKLNHRINKRHHVSANFLFSKDNFEFFNDFALARPESFDSKRKNYYLWSNWKWVSNPKFHSTTTLGYQNLSKEADFVFESSISNNNTDNRNTKILILNQNNSWELSDKHQLEFGLELKAFSSKNRFEELRVHQGISTPDSLVLELIDVNAKTNGHTVSTYLQDIWNISSKLRFQTGVRISNQSFADKITTAPRLALEYKFSDSFSSKLAYGIYYQPDNFQRLRAFQGQTDLLNSHNRSSHYIASFERRNQKSTVQVNLFFKDYDLSIDDFRLDFFNRLDSFRFLDRPFNLESATSKGFDISMRQQYGTRNLLTIAYTYANNKIQNSEGISVPRDFNRKHTITINNIIALQKNYTISALWSFHSGEPYTPTTVNFVGENFIGSGAIIYFTNGAKNSRQLPDYHTLDVRFEKKWFFKGNDQLTIYLNLVNIYNRKNTRNFYWGTTDNSIGERTIFQDKVDYFGIIASPGISFTF